MESIPFPRKIKQLLSPGGPLLWLVLTAVCLLLTGLLRLLCDTAAGPAVRSFAAGLSGGLSTLFSFSRRPVGEWLLPAVLLGVPLALVLGTLRRGRRGFFLWLSRMAALVCAILLLYMAAFGVQYTGPDLADTMGLDTGAYTQAQLEHTLTVLAKEINAVAPDIPRDDVGVCDFGSFASMARAVMEAYVPLAEEIPALAALSDSAPKETLFLGVPMSYLGITGFFFPWTGECVVSSNNPTVQQPFILAHESAHARRVGNENEANFAAFLVCVRSEDARLRYSGLHHGWIYVWNALYRTDPASAAALRKTLCPEAIRDLNAVSLHWSRYEGRLETLGNKVNDTYIKATGQPEGVAAYSRAADLIVAYIHSEMNIFS